MSLWASELRPKTFDRNCVDSIRTAKYQLELPKKEKIQKFLDEQLRKRGL